MPPSDNDKGTKQMTAYDFATKTDGEAEMHCENLSVGSSYNDTSNLFDILEEAELAHHDALVEMNGTMGPQTSQFKLLQGAACLLKTSPGKA